MRPSAEKTAHPSATNGLELAPGQPRIREATFEDYDQIAALQVRNGLRARSYEDWLATWISNPAYTSRGGEWPIGWVLETKGGKVVGSIGNIPLSYEFRGRELRAATSCSWVVDEGYRNYSMLVMSYLMRQKNVDLYVCTTVSAAAEPGYRTGFQFSKAPAGAWDRSAFWVTNYRGFARSVLTMKSIPFAEGLSYPLGTALFCWDRLRNTRSTVDGVSSEIELCADFDSRFDDFWTELTHQKYNVVLAARTRETLAWHFRYSLMRKQAWILAITRASRLVAYAVFDKPENPVSGLKRVRLVDFQALNGCEQELGSAIDWALRKCRQEEIHVLENAGCWLDPRGLRQISRPNQRKLSSWVYYYRAPDKDLAETLTDPSVWAPSLFDGDASL